MRKGLCRLHAYARIATYSRSRAIVFRQGRQFSTKNEASISSKGKTSFFVIRNIFLVVSLFGGVLSAFNEIVYEPLRDRGTIDALLQSKIFYAVGPNRIKPDPSSAGDRSSIYQPLVKKNEFRLLILDPGRGDDESAAISST